MKLIPLSLLVLVAFSGVQVSAEEAVPSKLGVMVVADAALGPDKDNDRYRPEFEKPVYYFIAGRKQLELGDVVQGVPMPQVDQVEREVVAALNSQGFVQVQAGDPVPSIGIMIVWGAANFHNYKDANRLMLMRDQPLMNRISGIRKLGVGPRVFDSHVVVPPGRQQVILTAESDRLYVAVSAVNTDALEQGVAQLLWRTSMTIDWKNRLADSLPVMLASAAPYFGRESAEPVFIGERERRVINVEIGDATVVPAPAPRNSISGATSGEG